MDAEHQVILAQGLSNNASDAPQLVQMLTAIKANTGRQRHVRSSATGDEKTQSGTRVQAMWRGSNRGDFGAATGCASRSMNRCLARSSKARASGDACSEV